MSGLMIQLATLRTGDLDTLFNETEKFFKNSMGLPHDDYLTSAVNLFPLLQAVAKAHPYTDVVINTFIVGIQFEIERRENDSRIKALFFAQVHVMWTLAQLCKLSTESANINFTLPLTKVEADLKACGAAIDTYYKQKKLVKYFLARDWKDKILAFAEKFDKHHGEIAIALSLHGNFQNDFIISKVKELSTAFFDYQSAIEKRIKAKVEEYGGQKECLGDDNKLKELLLVSKDYSDRTDGAVAQKPSKDKDKDRTAKLGDLMGAVRNDIEKKLEELLKANYVTFERKLNLKMEGLVSGAVREVIRELSGPHDRVQNEDLRSMWKEQKWGIFVEDAHFIVGLHEYYLDHQLYLKDFTMRHGAITSGKDTPSPPPGILHSDQPPQPVEASPDSDTWALHYISSRYSHQILESIDSDMSGFVRIGEVNSWTKIMPAGWTLPQWCAFWVAGWPYELYQYQQRIAAIFECMVQEQTRVLPGNRGVVADFLNDWELAGITTIARGPRYNDICQPALQEIVEEKIKHQDDLLRLRLQKLEYVIDATDTIHRLCGNGPVEHYCLQLVALLLERCLQAIRACETKFLDPAEFQKMSYNLFFVSREVERRIAGLERSNKFTRKNCDVAEEMKNFSSGVFRMYDRYGRPDFKDEEVQDRLDSVLELGGTHPILLGGAGGFKIREPGDIPRDTVFFRHVTTACDKCEHPIIDQVRFRCIECDDFDLCARCLLAKEVQHDKHDSLHNLVKITCPVPVFYGEWLVALARYYADALPRIDWLGEPMPIFCVNCKRKDPQGTIYRCLEGSCQLRDFYLCEDCERIISGDPKDPPEPDKNTPRDDPGHQPWHALLMIVGTDNNQYKSLTPDAVKEDGDERESRLGATSRAVSEVVGNTESQVSGALEGKIGFVEGSLGRVVGRVHTLEETMGGIAGKIHTLGERMGGFDGKMQTLEATMSGMDDKIDELKGLLVNGSNKPRKSRLSCVIM